MRVFLFYFLKFHLFHTFYYPFWEIRGWWWGYLFYFLYLIYFNYPFWEIRGWWWGYFYLFFILTFLYPLYYPFLEMWVTCLCKGYSSRESRTSCPVLQVHSGSFCVSVIHRTRTWTTGSLTVHTWSFACVRIHTGVGHRDNESAQHFGLWKNSGKLFLRSWVLVLRERGRERELKWKGWD